MSPLLPPPPPQSPTRNDTENIHTLHKSLTTLATTLLSELTAFHTHLNTILTTTTTNPLITHPNTLLSKFETDVRRELDHLLKYGDPSTGTGCSREESGDQSGGKGGDGGRDDDGNGNGNGNADVDLDGIHRIRSSNITFLADVWEGVKRGTGVVGIRKGVRYYPVPVPVLGRGDGGRGVVVRQGRLDGETAAQIGTETGTGTGTGIKGVSKKMNREARERVKRERGMESRCQSQGDQGQSQTPDQTPTKKDTNIDDNRNRNGNITSKPSADAPADHPDHPDHPDHSKKPRTNPTPRKHKDKESVTIDIISDHGATWTKIFTKNERWILMDLAKEGIVYDDSDSAPTSPSSLSCSSNSAAPNPPTNPAIEDLKLIKMAREFMAASRTSRVGRDHRHPRVRFYLPKVRRGVVRDVDWVLGCLGGMGVDVVTMEELRGSRQDECGGGRDGNGAENRNRDMRNGSGNGIGTGMNGSDSYESSLRETFERMACPMPPVPITEMLNVDCTILIALTSDVSHMRQRDIQIPAHYQGAARRDIEVQLHTDVDDPLLPNHIYPILRGRRLVCTRKAMEHWKNIVRIMGSPSEAERCRIFLGEMIDGDSQGLSVGQRLQRLSVHDVPEDIQLPFEVVDFDLDDMSTEADDSICKQVEIDVMRELVKEPRLSSLNSSVFFHGYYKGLTTVSLNRVVSEWLNRAINVILDDLELRAGTTSDIAEVIEFCGANVLICGRERSLLGSEK